MGGIRDGASRTIGGCLDLFIADDDILDDSSVILTDGPIDRPRHMTNEHVIQ